MSRRLVAAAVVAATALAASSAGAAGDPYVQWKTIETPHFRIHYPNTIEPVAEYVADLGEEINHRLAPALGWTPTEVTELVLTDNTESANGSATAIPYDTIRLYVTAPDDMSPLSEFDDWHLELVTHEYTHILHTDHISGLPAVLNSLFGKTGGLQGVPLGGAPNQVQPRWILEGLAVLEESEHTSGGRNRSSIFDMYLRADVLSERVAGLDQICNNPRRWPGGNFWYLYGSRFLTWIAHNYGDYTMRAIAADYGRQIIPFGINRSIRRATGRTYAELDDRDPGLFDEWRRYLRHLYGEQIANAEALPGGLREGTRLTHHGRVTERPRWVPEAARRDPAVPEVVYYLEDGHHRAGFYRMPVVSSSEAWESDRDLFVRAQGELAGSFDRRGAFVFSNFEVHKNVYDFSDVLRLPPRVSSTEGTEPERQRLTFGQRAMYPDVSPDGSKVGFILNRHGTQYLAVADLSAEGTLGEARVVEPQIRFAQAYTPRWSPDGKRIAYSNWARGGYRDIRIVDPKDGSFVEVTHDRALDMQPSWSHDGKTLYFVSDRTGIPNVYAYDVATRDLWMVTNVRTGAFMPEPSPDGKTLLYVGYTSDGFDLYGMPIDRTTWHKAPDYDARSRPDPIPPPPHHDWPKHDYDPLPTLRPRSWAAQYGPGTFGQTLVVSTSGSDVVGLHAFNAAVSIDTAHGDPQFSVGYTYGRLPYDVGITLFRSLQPGDGYRINGTEPSFIDQNVGISSSLTYTVPRAFDSFQFMFGYTASLYDPSLPVGPRLDPQQTITLRPDGEGLLATVRGAFGYSNAERYVYSIGASRGFSFQVTADVSNHETGSEYDLYSFGYSLTKYTQMPWHPDHVLVLHGASGIAGGNYPRRGIYYVGGYVDIPPIDTFVNGALQGGFVLRGYPPYAYSGRQFHLASAEYRFPIWYPEMGLSTLPFFWNRVAGAAYVDYGGAFDDIDPYRWRSQFHTGYGFEFLLDTTLGYFATTTTKIGWAKGLSPEAYPGGRFYFVFSAGY